MSDKPIADEPIQQDPIMQEPIMQEPIKQVLGSPLISVKVVAAMPHKQVVKDLTLSTGSSVRDAIELSAIIDAFDDWVIDPKMVGIFGTKVKMEQELNDGDRVEIYRPLVADPKEVRRQRAIRQAEAGD